MRGKHETVDDEQQTTESQLRLPSTSHSNDHSAHAPKLQQSCKESAEGRRRVNRHRLDMEAQSKRSLQGGSDTRIQL